MVTPYCEKEEDLCILFPQALIWVIRQCMVCRVRLVCVVIATSMFGLIRNKLYIYIYIYERVSIFHPQIIICLHISGLLFRFWSQICGVSAPRSIDIGKVTDNDTDVDQNSRRYIWLC